MKKVIAVGGFTPEQRQKKLEAIKIKYTKKGYEYKSYLENGALKSVAVFEVSEAIAKKEKGQNLLLLGAFFLALSGILYYKSMMAG